MKNKKILVGVLATLGLAGIGYLIVKSANKFYNNLQYRSNGDLKLHATIANVRITAPMTLINKNAFAVGIQGFEGQAMYGDVPLSNITIDKLEIPGNSEIDINIYADASPLGLLGNLITIVDERMLEEFQIKGKIKTSIVDIPYQETWTWKDVLKESGIIPQKNLAIDNPEFKIPADINSGISPLDFDYNEQGTLAGIGYNNALYFPQ